MLHQTSIPCGIAVPQIFPHGPVDMGLVKTFATRAEALGYDGLWVLEDLVGDTATLEPISLLSYVAAITERVKLGTSMVVATTRHPGHLAKEFGSLDQMSGGRLVVGLGIGGRTREQPPITEATLRLFGAPAERRVRHFLDTVGVMRALWEQTRARYNGHFWTLDGEQMEPKPFQRPRIPVWFGGGHPDGLRRAVRHADGWMGAGSSTTREFKSHVRVIREALEASGRDPASFPIAKRVYVVLDQDEGRAERRLQEWYAQFYKSADRGSAVSVRGGATQCIDGLMEVVEGGAQMLMFNPAFDYMDHLEALARDVVPHLRAP